MQLPLAAWLVMHKDAAGVDSLKHCKRRAWQPLAQSSHRERISATSPQARVFLFSFVVLSEVGLGMDGIIDRMRRLAPACWPLRQLVKDELGAADVRGTSTYDLRSNLKLIMTSRIRRLKTRKQLQCKEH